MENLHYIPIEKITLVQNSLLKWYAKHARNFPWRSENSSTYEILISEIFLQRTKAETIKKFFPLFIAKYPDWETLAKTPLAELEKDLKPIGLYKQRGSRLNKLAKKIIEFNEELPESIEEIRKLPMIGHYILNAYILFILKKPAPLLDVNMARVLERVFGKRDLVDIRYDPYLNNLAERIVYMAHEKSKHLNWAILDLGAIICKKTKPACLDCPINSLCKSFLNQTN